MLLVLAVCAGGRVRGVGADRRAADPRRRCREFQRATEARDYQALCDRVLAPELIDAVRQVGLPCELALEKGFEDVETPRLTVGAIAVDGDRATAEVRSSAEGEDPEPGHRRARAGRRRLADRRRSGARREAGEPLSRRSRRRRRLGDVSVVATLTWSSDGRRSARACA